MEWSSASILASPALLDCRISFLLAVNLLVQNPALTHAKLQLDVGSKGPETPSFKSLNRNLR